MTDLGNVLLKTLHGINDGYKQAKGDFDEIIAEVEEALRQVRPELKLTLVQQDKAASGTMYKLVLSLGDDEKEIGFYEIAAGGYPLIHGRGLLYGANVSGVRSLNTKDEVRKHFVEMLENKNSPLVVQLAYLTRH